MTGVTDPWRFCAPRKRVAVITRVVRMTYLVPKSLLGCVQGSPSQPGTMSTVSSVRIEMKSEFVVAVL